MQFSTNDWEATDSRLRQDCRGGRGGDAPLGQPGDKGGDKGTSGTFWTRSCRLSFLGFIILTKAFALTQWFFLMK